MAMELPQVSKLWLVISKSMLPVEHLRPKILMAVAHCGHQIARRLVQVSPAYLEKDVHQHSMQDDRRLMWCSWMWVGTQRIGSVSGEGGEIHRELRKRMVDVRCSEEVRWQRQS